MTKTFYKFFDKETAEQLLSAGFSFITETIQDGQTVYAFEKSEEIDKFIGDNLEFSDSGSPAYIEDSIISI